MENWQLAIALVVVFVGFYYIYISFLNPQPQPVIVPPTIVEPKQPINTSPILEKPNPPSMEAQLSLPVIPSQCTTIKKDGNFNRLATKPISTWTDNDRNTAIVILQNNGYGFKDGKSGQAHSNQDLFNVLVSCL